jgi:hypothetical protein
VSGEDAGVIEHARVCLRCRASLYEQREVVAAARALARPSISVERRRMIAAEVMAAGDRDEAGGAGRRGRSFVIATGTLAAAAILALVVSSRGMSADAPASPALNSSDQPALELAYAAHLDPVAPALRADVITRGADFARLQQGDQDVVTLRDGEVSIDAMDREPIVIVAGDTRVTISSSRAKVIARQGVIVTTHVFAGTAQITANGRSRVIDAGDVWTREPEAAPPQSDDSLAGFRTGWEQLRAHDYAKAIASFDRATDPVVAEDAAFWAAIAAERAGDSPSAATRLRGFLDRFPSSPRADAARAALERVTK